MLTEQPRPSGSGAGFRERVSVKGVRGVSDTTAIAAITAAAAALRFATLHVQSFDGDEAVTIGLLHRSLGGMLHEIPITEQTPPLYYVMAWLWVRVFGFAEVGVRSLSALAGTATVPLAYAAARRFAGRRVGVLTALLVAFNPLMLWYSQEARSYAVFAAFSAGSLWFFARALNHMRVRDLWMWAGLAGLSLLTHYFAVFIIAPQAGWLLSTSSPAIRRRVLTITGLPVVIGLALVPLAIAQRSPKKYPFTRLESLGTRITAIPREALAGFSIPSAAAWMTVILVLLAISVVLLIWRTRPPERITTQRLALVVVVALIVPILLAVAGLDFVLSRNFIALVVPASVIAAVGFASSRVGWLAVSALCLVWFAEAIVVDSDVRWQRPPWRQVAKTLSPPAGSRVIYVMPTTLGVDSLATYLSYNESKLSTVFVPVSEIDVVGILDPASSDYHALEQLLPPSPGFHEVLRRTASTYIVLRFVRSRPVIPSPQHPISLRLPPSAPQLSRATCCAGFLQASGSSLDTLNRR